MAPDAKLAVAIALDGVQGGTDAQVLAAIDWAVDRGVDVLNMSLGGLTLGPEVPSTYTEAILTSLRAGIPVVTAIGNDGQQIRRVARQRSAFILRGGDRLSGLRCRFQRRSNPYHRKGVQLRFPGAVASCLFQTGSRSAPGVAVFSSVPNGKWAAFNGTSMATPHVAGAIALLLSATSIKQRVVPTNRAFLIQDLLTGSVEELGETGQDHRFGFGRIDILQSIGFAKEKGFLSRMPQYNQEDSDRKLEAPGPARTVVSKTNLLDKLQGEELQRMASEKLEQKASVIIELDVPPQKVGLRKSAGASLAPGVLCPTGSCPKRRRIWRHSNRKPPRPMPFLRR